MIKGSIVALITPMNEEGSVDYAGLEKLIQFHLDEQTDGLLVLGTTGESSTLTQSEEEQILQLTVKKVAGRVPVIAGAGTNNTKETIEKRSILLLWGQTHFWSSPLTTTKQVMQD